MTRYTHQVLLCDQIWANGKRPEGLIVSDTTKEVDVEVANFGLGKNVTISLMDDDSHVSCAWAITSVNRLSSLISVCFVANIADSGSVQPQNCLHVVQFKRLIQIQSHWSFSIGQSVNPLYHFSSKLQSSLWTTVGCAYANDLIRLLNDSKNLVCGPYAKR